ncbi:MAG TPA: hypothetical protein PJ988_16370 [Anaerolinea sp.]|nr:hypothetical protein [Anaerolinea sp.]
MPGFEAALEGGQGEVDEQQGGLEHAQLVGEFDLLSAAEGVGDAGGDEGDHQTDADEEAESVDDFSARAGGLVFG